MSPNTPFFPFCVLHYCYLYSIALAIAQLSLSFSHPPPPKKKNKAPKQEQAQEEGRERERERELRWCLFVVKFIEVGPTMANFEETELRLGLPGGGGEGGDVLKNSTNNANYGKRGFEELAVDLKLKLSSKEATTVDLMSEKTIKPPSKSQVVGWPPLRPFRKNILAVQKSSTDQGSDQKASSNAAAFVKVSLDGAPYLRKVDLKMYESYQELSDALGNMFSSFTIGNCGSQGMKDFMNESKLMDLLSGSDYVPTYEDKDGDWMLVGDVPWKMFVDSCKRLRIMKGKEAMGLAPRAMEKCKNMQKLK